MKKILIILFVFIANLASSQIRLGGVNNSNFTLDYANPAEYEIGGITVSGVKFLDENALISLTGLKIGDKIAIPGDDLSMAIKKLWDQGILGDIELRISKIEGQYVFFDFKLEEKPRLTKFAFEGVKKTEADDIREKISLIRGRTVSNALLNRTEVKVNKYYVQKGFRNVDVQVIQKKDSILPNSVILVIKVDKKEKVKIENILITGNTVFETKKLQKKMKDTKIAKQYRVFKTSKVLPGAIARDKNAIIDMYNSKGYRDAEIDFDTIYDVSEDRVILKMNINEASQYHFGNITWTGNFVYDDKELSNILGIEKGSIYNKELLDKRLNFNPSGRDITSQYMDDGYLFFNIQPVEINAHNDSINIEMRIYEGEQATIAKVIINGNTKTSDHVIRRELRTLPGQKFSRTNIIRTQRELSQLGYFEAETMGINPIPHPENGTVDIVYDLTEKANDQFTLSGGYGGFYGFVGTVGLVFNNFAAGKLFKPKEYDPLPGGNGQRVSVNIQANGRTYKSYNLSFTEPWLGGKKPNSLTTSLRHSVQKPFDQNNDSTFLKVSGITIYLGRRLQVPDDFFNISNSVSLLQYNLRNFGVADQFPIKKGKAYNLSFNNTISRNSVGNRPEFPTYGSSISLSSSFTPPYSLFDGINDYSETPDEIKYKFAEYHKWMLDATWYKTLIKGKKQDYNLVLRTSFHGGYLGNYNDKIGYTPFERFVMGGSGLSGAGQSAYLLGQETIALRGYGENTPFISGRGLENSAQAAFGTKFTKFVAELRYPISLNPMATVYPIAFFEMGNNWDEFNNLDFFNLYRSTGVGVRIFMPMFGMIGFDYGFPLDGPSAQTGADFLKSGQFHFMIGQQIR